MKKKEEPEFEVDIYECVDDSGLREQMSGVYHDKEFKMAVASNGHVLMVSSSRYNDKYAGKVIDDEGEVVTARNSDEPVRFVNYHAVMPKLDFAERRIIDMKDFEKKLRAVAGDEALYPQYLHTIYIGGMLFGLKYAELMYRFMRQHCMNTMMYFGDHSAAVVCDSLMTEYLMVMPIMYNDDVFEPPMVGWHK